MRLHRIPIVLSLFVAGVLALGMTATPAFAGVKPVIPACHNDTNMPNHFVNGSPLGGDPNIGLKANGGYYYLDLTACANTVTFNVTTIGCWHVQAFNGPDHNSPQLLHFDVMDKTVSFTLHNTIPGHIYAARVDNTDNIVVTDHSVINSP